MNHYLIVKGDKAAFAVTKAGFFKVTNNHPSSTPTY
tara:strand:- start:272 stop:379 length:108 start_codon:yes stop_codon:yes gene_type:complete